MNCPHCDAPQAEGARFCRNCGQPLVPAAERSCPACHSPNAPGARFCKSCGAGLATAASGGASPAAAAVAQREAARGVPPRPAQSGRPASSMRLLLIVGVVVVALAVLAAAVWFFAFREKPETGATERPSVVQPAAPASSPDGEAETGSTEDSATSVETELLSGETTLFGEESFEGDATARETEFWTETDQEETPVRPAPVAHPAPQVQPQARPTPEAQPAPQAATPAPEAPPQPKPKKRTCDGVAAFNILICRMEGPAQFWRCAPDGINWDHDIPGCRRNTGNPYAN